VHIPGLADLWHAAFTAVPNFFLFLLPLQRLRIMQNMCVYIHISDCVQTVHKLPLLPNNTAVKHFYTNQERCEMLTGHLSLGAPAWRWLDQCMTLDRTFYNLCFKQEAVAAPSYCHIFCLIIFLEEAFIRNIIVLCINYIIKFVYALIIIMQ